jgi:orotidine-5'-phosphate decarboxylase
MNLEKIKENIKKRKTFLCVGLDPDHTKINKENILDFNKRIIDQTFDLAIAYKPNIAFYESLGLEGWSILEKTIEYIGNEHFTIADAKRADIGNTSKYYAKTFFERYNFDAITANPYMGEDSIRPFLDFENKCTILLALTSNRGASDFQTPELYKKVIDVSSKWADQNKIMYVVGATKAERLKEIRQQVPEHFLLIPGVGHQGGDFDSVCANGLNEDCGLIINSARQIIFAENPRTEAKKLQEKMQIWLEKINFI